MRRLTWLGLPLLLIACSGDDEHLADDGDDGGDGADASVPLADAGPPGECGPGTAWDGAACAPSDKVYDRRGCLGKYGPVALTDPAVFVDASAPAAGADGSAAAPFPTLAAGIAAADEEQVVAVAAGTYDEDVTIDLPLTIEARCARDVTLDGTLTILSPGVKVRGLAITNGTPGLAITDAADGAGGQVELRWLHVHGNHGAGARALRSRVLVQDTEVSGTDVISMNRFGEDGVGFYIADGSDVGLGTSVISMNGKAGVDVADASGDYATAVISMRSTAVISMSEITNNQGEGLRVRHADAWLGSPPGAMTELSVTDSTFSGNSRHAALVHGTRLSFTGNQVGGNGAGFTAGVERPAQVYVELGHVTLTGNDFEDIAGFAFYQSGGEVISMNNTADAVDGGFAFLVYGKGTFVNNSITGSTGGIAVLFGDASVISMNQMTGMVHAGIHVDTSAGVTVSDNQIDGVALFDSPLGLLTVYESGQGITLKDTPGADVDGNVVKNTAGAGLDVRCYTPTDTLALTGNTVENATLAGANLHGCGGGVDFSGNTITGAKGYGLRMLAMKGSQALITGNTITGTLALDAGDDGDALMMDNSDAVISMNMIPSAARIGILATGATCTGVVQQNTVGTTATDIVFQNAPSMADGGNTADPAQSVPSGTHAVDKTEVLFNPDHTLM